MQHLWSPWRMDYILGPKPDFCIFCLPDETHEDARRLILYRGKTCFVIMNKYPYNNGHLMVVPYAHHACITDLDAPTCAEMMHLVQQSAAILKKHFSAQGINIGMNIGAAAGAGVKEHLHCHLVPRWNGDANFITVLADVRTVPQHLEEGYKALLPYFAKLKTAGMEL